MKMKNKTVFVEGIEVDSRIFTAINKKEERHYLHFPYYNKEAKEVVVTDGRIMLIQKVDVSESQQRGFVNYVIPEDMRSFTMNAKIEKQAERDFYKGKTSNFVQYVITPENQICTFPDYKRVIPEQKSENRICSLKEFYADGLRLYKSQSVDVFPDGSYKVTAEIYKKGFFVPVHYASAFDFELFKNFYKFFDYPDDAEVYYTGALNPLLAISEKEGKTAVLMPIKFDYGSEYVKIEGKKATSWRVW